MARKRKGGRMIAEIQRLKAMGLGKRAIARTLKISRNTLRKYWDPQGEGGPTEESGDSYRAPWSNAVDWNAVRKKLGQGQTLRHYWEEFRETLPVVTDRPYGSIPGSL
ncbi:MAG: helix-turn-helix domain-containing protein [Leptospirillia bacterium]